MQRILDIFTSKDFNPQVHVSRLEGLNASARSLYVASLFRTHHLKVLFILNDQETASYAYNDLAMLLDRTEMAILPSAFRKSPRHGETDIAQQILRTDAQNLMTTADSWLVMTSPAGIAEMVASQQQIERQRIMIAKGDRISQQTITTQLEKYHFEEVEFVYQPGQYSLRGSIIDVFSYTNERPYRIDFFGDEVESIRTFDIERQLSLDKTDAITILPDISADQTQKAKMVTLPKFIPEDTLLVYENYDNTIATLERIYDDSINGSEITISPDRFAKEASPFRTIHLHGSARYPETPTQTISFHIQPQPLFHKNFDFVADTLSSYQAKGYALYICSDSVKQTDRIASIFDQRGDDIRFTPISRTLHEGFIDTDRKVVCFTDHQIFDRFHRFSLRSDITKAGKAAITLKEINELQLGDYVVHSDHGIGKFAGLMVMQDGDRKKEVIKLVYQNNDVVYVSIHSLHKVSKYKGKDNEPPQVSKLGSGAWERLKERTKAKIKDIAKDLIQLYAARCQEQGFQFNEDDYMQHELEASFLYEDTPDQATATADIKRDMQSARPMDRLVCGDVGFGKTELAIRAAFKAATSGKQVAVLVPTTVLALQHFKTFSDRLKEFPVRIEYLSRAKKPAEVRSIKQNLAEGKIDILIGTHKIVGKDVIFRDLGLLIIDEEQKFGVSIKEKLKQLKVNVDTLTLTATPIPRTLQFSLMGARDLSILNTAPPNRYPVLTEVSVWDPILIADAINTEINRNGQVFVINNRVQNIEVIAEKIRRLVPSARIAIAHGQMPTDQLEQVILDFIDYEYDVLIATSVIESGVDIPNVNTMIVNNAHMFGLSDLHQLRGRVGRSNRKAYCYLIAPDLDSLTAEARMRLKAIETFADLGSGFSIAMQDLDIRGAGNILGAEQSGFITDLGYETYQQILNEALVELHGEADDGTLPPIGAGMMMPQECNMESDLGLMFPNWYISSQTERIALYRELDSIQTEASLSLFREKMVDRFGAIPDEVEGLFDIVRLRWAASHLQMQKLLLTKGKMTCFLAPMDSKWYESPQFTALLSYAMKKPAICHLEQRNGKGLFSVANVHSPAAALAILTPLSTPIPQ